MSNPIRKMRRQKLRAMDHTPAAAPAVEEVTTTAEAKAPPAPRNGPLVDANGVTVSVEFLPEHQSVRVGYDRTKVKSWDMVIAMLTMALENARTNRTIGINNAMARKHQEAIESQMIAMELANNSNGQKRILT